MYISTKQTSFPTLLATLLFLFLSCQTAQAQIDCNPAGTAPLTIAFEYGPTTCDVCNGFAQVFATGGTTPYTYSWNFNPGINTPTVTNLCPGTYVVTVTDMNNCTAAGNFVISYGTLPPTTIALNVTQPNCGSNNGAITALATGGGVSGGYIYQWSSGATTPTITNLQAGTYCVTVTDAVGCTAQQCAVLQPVLNINSQPATCELCNGSISLPDSSLYVITSTNGITQTYIGPVELNGLCTGFYNIFNQTTNCQDSAEITNLNLPFTADADFTTSVGNADVLYACTGQPIQFFAPDGNLSVLWNFGEPTSPNNTSNLPNTTYTYQNTGAYTITLIAQGCTDADTLQRTIIIEQGIAPTIDCASLVCPGVEQTYTTPVVCDTYNWTVTGGSITAGQNTADITVVWNDVAMGTVELTVGDCDGSTICNPVGSIQVPIVSNNLPINGPDVVCANTLAVYSVPQYGGVQYTWAVAPAASGTVVWQQYNQAGVQWHTADGAIQVNAVSSLVGCSSVSSMPVEVNQVYTLSGFDLVCRGAEVTYTASSGLHNWTVTGNASIVGSGANTNSINVQVGLGFTGYTVSATPANPTQYCNYPQTITVNIGDQPAPPLILSSGYVCPGNAYTYEIASPAAGVSYFWNVTGGTPATGSGSALSITWNVGSPTYTILVTAQSNSAPFCTAALGTNIPPLTSLVIDGSDDLCAGDKVLYTAQPFLPDLNYEWTINPPLAGSVVAGQGTVSAEVQWNAGFPFVTLSVNACNVSQDLLVAIHPLPSPTVTASGNLCAGSSISIGVTPPVYSQYEWQNGSISPATGVSAGGSYVVTVTDVNGCQGVGSINVHEYPLPDASISPQDLPLVCTDNLKNIDISALVAPGYNYLWFVNGSSFGGSVNTVTHTGTTTVANFNYSVVVTDANGCQNTSNTVTIEQQICNFNPGSCPGGACPIPGGGGGGDCDALPGAVIGNEPVTPYCFDLTFQNISVGGSNFVWDFGDGSPLVFVPDTSPQNHTFNEPGFYVVKITGTFPNANPIPPLCNYMSYSVVEIPLKADFDLISPCLGTATQFTDRSRTSVNTTITSWNWDFGDGNSATDANPAHIFPASGNYEVTLTISDGFCTSTITKTVTIYDLPDAGFTIPSQICQATAANFIPDANPNAITWDWDFGNGATVSAPAPDQTYLQDGNYTVQLAVTDNRGCTNTGSQTITVLPVSNGAISPAALTACEGQTITLTAPAGAGYLWNNNITTPTLAAAQTGSYTVTVTQANGCTFNTPPVQLNFAPLPPAGITPPTSPANLCPGATLNLNANAGTGYAYAWSTGQNASGITIPYASVPASGLTVTVTVTDSQTGCTNVSLPVNINAINLPPPAINPNFPADLQLCEGETLTLTATHPTLSNFTWNNGAAGNAITVSAAGNYAVVVTDANGCTNAAGVSVGVNEGGDMAPIPVGCYDYCELQPFSVPNVFSGYQWLLNGAPIAGANSHTFVPPQTGNYQLQITTVWGCQDTSDMLSLNLTDCLECLVSAAFTHTLSCSTIQLNSAGASGNGALSYSWDFGDGNTSTTPSPSHSYATSGNYTVCLTVTNLAADGDTCTNSTCTDIVINGADLLSIATDSVTDANCGEADGSISITVLGNNPPYNYQWSDLITDEDRINLPAGAYDLTVTDSGGCSATASFTIAELPLAASPLACLSATQSELTVTWTAVNNASGYELTINGGSPITLLPDVTDYTFTGLVSGVDYVVTLVVLAPSPCIGSVPSIVTCTTLIDPCLLNSPTAATQATDTPCGASEGNITLTVTGGAAPYTYLWSNQSPDENPANLPGGAYTVTVTDALGCTATATATVGEYLPAPTLSCLNATDTALTVTWTAVNGASGYELTINGGSPIPLLPDVTDYTFTGLQSDTNYNISLIASASGSCVASAAALATCLTAPPACTPENIGATIAADTEMVQPGEPATLTVTATGLTGNLSYMWAANGITTACGDSICIFTPDVPTTYAVTVTDMYNCTATASLFIDVRMPNKVVAPNAFSPNGDAVNSLFRLAGFNVAEVQFSVWNRWGQKVYDSGITTNLSLGWDGTFKGQDCELGVYVFQANIRYTDGSTDWVKGNVTLIR
ncbi:MAG TPA: PKD domain-containing protein [Chitinophagales bacterium]|nr:PKD domain-containing protein [Chitinophagales bacterium]